MSLFGAAGKAFTILTVALKAVAAVQLVGEQKTPEDQKQAALGLTASALDSLVQAGKLDGHTEALIEAEIMEAVELATAIHAATPMPSPVIVPKPEDHGT